MYADDTALITNNVNAMNRLIGKIETRADYYGLNFNKGKCVAMVFNSVNKIKFKDGSLMPTPKEAVIFGQALTKHVIPN